MCLKYVNYFKDALKLFEFSRTISGSPMLTPMFLSNPMKVNIKFLKHFGVLFYFEEALITHNAVF